MINAYRNIADDPGRVGALDDELTELCGKYLNDGVMEWEYLSVVARKAGSEILPEPATSSTRWPGKIPIAVTRIGPSGAITSSAIRA
jgi:hypothetical protein